MMNTLYKGLFVLFFAVLTLGFGASVQAQQPCSYQIVATGSYTQAQVQGALDQAKLDAYRFQTQRRTLNFDNGAQVILFSATEMQNLGCSVNAQYAIPDGTPIDPNRIFSISPSGVIMEGTAARQKN